MHSMIYILGWISCSLTLSLFSFLMGRCARRLPIIDDCMQPWIIHRGAISSGAEMDRSRAGPKSP